MVHALTFSIRLLSNAGIGNQIDLVSTHWNSTLRRALVPCGPGGGKLSAGFSSSITHPSSYPHSDQRSCRSILSPTVQDRCCRQCAAHAAHSSHARHTSQRRISYKPFTHCATAVSSTRSATARLPTNRACPIYVFQHVWTTSERYSSTWIIDLQPNATNVFFTTVCLPSGPVKTSH